MSSTLKGKIKYLYSIINYDKKNIDDIRKDIHSSNSFKTQCLLYKKINDYREDIEDTTQLIKEIIATELSQEQPGDSSDLEEDSPDTDNSSGIAIEAFDENGNRVDYDSLPDEVKSQVQSLIKQPTKIPDIDLDHPITQIDFKTFLILYGILFLLNQQSGLSVLAKGNNDMVPTSMDLLDMTQNQLIASNITNFSQLFQVLNSQRK